MRTGSCAAVVLAALLFTACSGSNSDEASESADGDGEAGSEVSDSTAQVVVASTLPAGRAQCGPFELTSEAVALGSPRITDAAMEAFADSNVELAAPEQWVLVDESPNLIVIADPVPLVPVDEDDGVASVWMRALVPGVGLLYDDACRLAAPLDGSSLPIDAPPAAKPFVCVADPLPGAVVVSWERSPGALIVRQDEFDMLTLSDGALPENVEAGLAERREAHADQTPPAGLVGVVLQSQPGQEHDFRLAASNESWESSCGSAAALDLPQEPADAGGADTGESADGADLSLLERSATEGPQIPVAPYAYATLTPICDTCDGETVELYLVPSAENPTTRVVEAWWKNGEPQPLDEIGVWGTDPTTVAGPLVEQGAEDWEVDPDSLLVLSWTVDGVGASLECLELDLSPLEGRSERCGAANLLGR